MKRRFVVIDQEGNVSWNEKTEKGENFSTFKAARKRAEEIAASEPGGVVSVYELTAESLCAVAPVETAHKHPREHYEP